MTAQPKIIRGSDVLDVYLDGFTTGAASVMATLAPSIPEVARDTFAQRLAQGLRDDPVALATVEAEIRERLEGVDTGPKGLVVPLRPVNGG